MFSFEQPRPFALLPGGPNAQNDFLAGGVHHNAGNAGGAANNQLMRSITLGPVPPDQVFPKFFQHPNNPLNDHDREAVRVTLAKNARISHIANPAVGFGGLVPDGFSMNERFDVASGRYDCTIARERSSYVVRISNQAMPDVPLGQRPREDDAVRTIIRNALMRFNREVLRIDVVPPWAYAGQPGQAITGPEPEPVLVRDQSTGDVGLERAYIQPHADMVHAVVATLCRQHKAFEVIEASSPLSPHFGPGHPEEAFEQEFVLNSLYPTHLGPAKAKDIKFDFNNISMNMRPLIPGGPGFAPMPPR
jgi:hypothetical protein